MADSLYVKLDASYADDEKIILAGEKAELLYVRALCLAKRILSDGFIADAHLPRFGLSGHNARARKLVEVGLWERDDHAGGYWIVSWLKHNPSARDVEHIREKRRKAGRSGGQRSAEQRGNQSAKQDAKQGAEQDASANVKQTPNPEALQRHSSTSSNEDGEQVALAVVPPDEPPKRFVARLADDLRSRGHDPPRKNTRHEAYRALLDLALGNCPENAHHGITLGLIADYHQDVVGEPISTASRSHLARHVNTYDRLKVFDAVSEALNWGAGVDDKYREDDKALSKYVTAVLNGKASA